MSHNQKDEGFGGGCGRDNCHHFRWFQGKRCPGTWISGRPSGLRGLSDEMLYTLGYADDWL